MSMPPQRPRTLTILIPGPPHAQGRPRAAVINGHARLYAPAKSRNWKATAREHARAAMRRAGEMLPFSSTVAVDWIAVCQRPRSTYRKRSPRGRELRHQKPDADNIAKAILDAFNGVVFDDDSQVAVMSGCKLTGAQGEGAYTLVRIREVVAESLPEWAETALSDAANEGLVPW